jgi:DNA helicase II / ATP-dependent DNA helicase PcrA
LNVDELLSGMNPEQREAVLATEGPLLVLAGAGSGKTRVLTHRIAYLIGSCGIAPESILAVTFTNKAAGEMRERVAKLLGPEGTGVWLATFHATCVRILRSEIGQLGRSRGFVVYDESDSLGLVREAMRRRGLDPKGPDVKSLRWRIDQWKNAGDLPAAAAEKASDIEARAAAEIYATYQRLLAEANALDFGDLLLLTVDLFDRFPQVLRHYQERWQYLLIDEYQDTNRVQYRLVKQLAAVHGNVCVVGDPQQSIYGWRGADVNNILDFERDYPGAKTVKLARNYRSTQEILSGAGAVVEKNRGSPMQLIAERGKGERIVLYEARDERDEGQYVVRRILEEVRDGGRKYGQCAVFYRTNAQSRPIEEELLKYDVPYVVVGGVRFYDRAEVKDVLCYLRAVVNPADTAALARIANRPARGIGDTTLEHAQELARSRGVSFEEGMRLFAASDAAGRTRGKLVAFLEVLDAMRRDLVSLPPADAIAETLRRSGYLLALERENTPEAESRLENLRELVASAEDFAADSAEVVDEARTPLERFLDQVALVSDLDSAEFRHDRVSLMTVHSAKGLEFPVVFVAGLEEGIFPHQAATRDGRDVEEERRLCYVAMTRAMERLTLSYARERRRYGQHSFGSPSRFLREIPPKLLDFRGGAGFERTPEPTATRARDASGRHYDYSYDQGSSAGDDSAGEAGVRKGTRLRHPIFGVGVVLEVIGRGPSQKLRIQFDRAGVKTVLVRYANLEPG